MIGRTNTQGCRPGRIGRDTRGGVVSRSRSGRHLLEIQRQLLHGGYGIRAAYHRAGGRARSCVTCRGSAEAQCHQRCQSAEHCRCPRRFRVPFSRREATAHCPGVQTVQSDKLSQAPKTVANTASDADVGVGASDRLLANAGVDEAKLDAHTTSDIDRDNAEAVLDTDVESDGHGSATLNC